MQVNSRSRFLALLLVAVLPFSSGLALAGDGVSLDAAVAAAQERHRARVVKAEVIERDGRKVYSLRLLGGDGRVWTIRIDAATGAELNR
jgi:uncharacterized membrane protein YkoI